MKKFILLFFKCFVCVVYSSGQQKFYLHSKINNWKINEESILVNRYVSLDSIDRISIPIIKGQMLLTKEIMFPSIFEIDTPSEGLIKRTKRGWVPTKSNSIYFYAEPGMDILLEGNLSTYCEVYPSGSIENDNISLITKSVNPILDKYADLKRERFSGSDNDEKYFSIKTDSILNVLRDTINSSINKNPHLFSSLFFACEFLRNDYIKVEDVKNIHNSVDEKYKSLDYYQFLDYRIKSDRYSVGNRIFEINDKTPTGKLFNSNTLSGKYYIIDFWGYWCRPCMDGMPKLKKLKDKYNEKLEIVGINVGDNYSSWQSSLINNDSMAWIHIKDGKGVQKYSDILAINSFPTKILVGPDGTILLREVGENEGFEERIENFINNLK